MFAHLNNSKPWKCISWNKENNCFCILLWVEFASESFVSEVQRLLTSCCQPPALSSPTSSQPTSSLATSFELTTNQFTSSPVTSFELTKFSTVNSIIQNQTLINPFRIWRVSEILWNWIWSCNLTWNIIFRCVKKYKEKVESVKSENR